MTTTDVTGCKAAFYLLLCHLSLNKEGAGELTSATPHLRQHSSATCQRSLLLLSLKVVSRT